MRPSTEQTSNLTPRKRHPIGTEGPFSVQELDLDDALTALPDAQINLRKETMEELEKRLMTDYHLTRDEIRVIRSAYEARRKELFRASRKELQDFINKDYRTANEELLGGEKGVRALQKALWINADGKFGPSTFRTLIDYQKKNKLRTDGVAGPKTIAKLGIADAIAGKAEDTNAEKKREPAAIPQKTPPATRKTTKTPESPKRTETTPLPEPAKEPPQAPETPSLVFKTLKKHEAWSRSIRENLDSLRNNRDGNTGAVNATVDSFVEFFGGESGQDIYHRGWKQAREQAGIALRDLQNTVGKASLSKEERAQYEKLTLAYSGMSQENLGTAGVIKSVSNTVVALPEDFVLAGHGAWGMGKGVAEGVVHVFDLTVFLGKMAFSSEYRKAIGKQWDLIMEARRKAGGMTPLIADAFKTEVTRISSLPSEEQAEAIGKIPGVILGIGGTAAVSWKLGKTSVALVAASRTARVAQTTAEAMKQTAAAAQFGVEAGTAQVQATVAKAGSIALAGPAEAGISKVTSAVFNKAIFLINANKASPNTIQEAITKAIAENAEQMKAAVAARDKRRIDQLEKQLAFLNESQAKLQGKIPTSTERVPRTSAKPKPIASAEPKTATSTEPKPTTPETPLAKPSAPKDKPEAEFIPKYLRKPEAEAKATVRPTEFTYNPNTGIKENIRKFNSVYGPNGRVREGASAADIQRFDSFYTALSQANDVLKKAVKSGDSGTIAQATADVKKVLVDPDAGVKYVASDEFKARALSSLRESENGTTASRPGNHAAENQGNDFLKGVFASTYRNLDRQFSLMKHAEGSRSYLENLLCRELLGVIKDAAQSGRFTWNEAVANIHSFQKNPRQYVKEATGMDFDEAVKRRGEAWRRTQQQSGTGR